MYFISDTRLIEFFSCFRIQLVCYGMSKLKAKSLISFKVKINSLVEFILDFYVELRTMNINVCLDKLCAGSLDNQLILSII